tara:strand:- start:87 stop:212 length:126 start_codon:yes stop_codon:yes gene_type:complete
MKLTAFPAALLEGAILLSLLMLSILNMSKIITEESCTGHQT